MTDWILMIKGDEQKPVHPGNVDNHLRAGWRLAEEPAQQEPLATQPAVAVETPAAEEPIQEPEPPTEESSSDAPLASRSEDPV